MKKLSIIREIKIKMIYQILFFIIRFYKKGDLQ